MNTCKKCHKEKLNDELCDGECFECSTGDSLSAPASVNALRESMTNVSRGLGEKTVLTGKTVRERMLTAIADEKKKPGAN